MTGGNGGDPVLSSRTSREAAGWVGCSKASLKGVYRDDYTPMSFNWVDPRPLWDSRNDRIARWISDPTNDERRRWVAAQLKKGVDSDFVVDRFADKDTLSFVVLGDPGEGDASQYHVVKPLLARADGIDFTYICSDVIYPAGDVNDYYDKFFWPYQKLPGPIYAIPGNHDWYDGLFGFMTHMCSADADLRPPAKEAAGWRAAIHRTFWRKPSKPDQKLMERVRELRGSPAQQSDQPAPYFAIASGAVLLVGIDTGIQGVLDREQGAWLREISKRPGPKVLLTGKPMFVDAREKTVRIEGGGTVNAIVAKEEHEYVAVIGGDIHNYQRYPIRYGDRTVQHIVSGAAGAYTKATHKIPPVNLAKYACTEDDFRCYPRRGDSLAAYSLLYEQRFGRVLGRTRIVVPDELAPRIMSILLAEQGAAPPPTRPEDRDVPVPPEMIDAGRRVTRAPGAAAGFLHRNFSELLDWNDPPPPLFKSFLRVDAEQGRIEIRCWGVTGCAAHQDNPPLEDWIVGSKKDGRWEWEVLLA